MSTIKYIKDGNNHIITLPKRVRMTPIVRKEEELFSETVKRAQKIAGFDVCINANLYELTATGMADTLAGTDPVAAKETTNQGTILLGTNERLGRPSANAYRPETRLFLVCRHGRHT